MKERSPVRKKQKNRRKKRDVDDELDFLDLVVAQNQKQITMAAKSDEELA